MNNNHILMNIHNLTKTESIIINKRFVHASIQSSFFMSFTAKSCKIFPKHIRYLYISVSFALN